MVQVLKELESRGVDLSTVDYTHFGGQVDVEWPGGAKAFYEEKKSTVGV